MGIVIKRAKYFITCNGKYFLNSINMNRKSIEYNMVLETTGSISNGKEQLSLF